MLYSSDTLLIISDISNYLLLLPVRWEEIDFVEKGQEVEIYIDGTSGSGKGIINAIDKSVKVLNGKQFIFVTALSSEVLDKYRPGLITRCEIRCGESTIWEYFKRFLTSAIA